MPKYQCVCGAKYKFPDSAVGKKAKCKQCDEVFTLTAEDDAPIAISEEPHDSKWNLEDEVAAATARAREPREEAERPRARPAPVAAPAGVHNQGFAQSLLWTIFFPSTVNNLISFFALWIGLTVGYMLPCFLSILIVIWYAAFRFAVIESAAAGEKSLPQVEFSRAAVFEAIADALRWLASWAIALAPAIVYFFIMAAQGNSDLMGAATTLTGGVTGLLPGSGADPIMIILVCAGLFFWPIIVLVLTLGGYECLYRFDLIVATIVRSFPAYLLTIGVVFGATLLEEVLSRTVFTGMTAAATGGGIGTAIGTGLVAHALFVGITLYCNIVMLKAIGLYYHHNKERFAWDWG
jgi:hypothetical protein